MNPIPLSTPQGAVIAFACGQCGHVASSRRVGPGLDFEEKHRQDIAEDAERCCRCLDCGKGPMPQRLALRCPDCEKKEEARIEAFRAESALRRDAWSLVHTRELAKAKDAAAACKIVGLLREVSEDHYAAGWMSDLEYDLWEVVQAGGGHYGLGQVDDEIVAKLKRLAEEAGGWWAWLHEGDMQGELFVPMERWLGLYASWKDKRNAEDAAYAASAVADSTVDTSDLDYDLG